MTDVVDGHTVVVQAVVALAVELNDHISAAFRAVLFFIEPGPDDFDES